MSVLELAAVHKSFGRNEVLRGVDLEVAEHEVVCLIGASGSGKSTLLRCINLLDPIDSGRIFLRDQVITARGVDVNAVRRVVPPLLNDFIGLQKDTALVSTLGVVEALQQTRIDESAHFNGTYYLVAATLFVALTIPLARLTDWLVARDRRRQQAGRLA